MSSLVFLNGKFIHKEQAKISPFDRAFMFGDAVYEGVPIYEKQAFLLKEHYTRFTKNLKKINISQPLSIDNFKNIIATLANQATTPESFGIYFQISRGVQDSRSHKYDVSIKPTIFACIQPTTKVDFRSYKNGFIAHAELDTRWHKPHIKSTSLLANILHLKNNTIETILYDQDLNFTEGCSSNVFFVEQETIITPPKTSNILPGITRSHIFSIAESLGIKIIEKNCNFKDMHHYQEAFISGAYKEVAPIIKINETIIGNGVPGKIWEKIYIEYKASIKKLSTSLCLSAIK